MEIRVLRYFLMVAREENITKAANLLHLTQPTLSRQLMQLEEELGVTLFRRSKHRIILTEDGMLLRRRAEEIVSLAEKTRDDLRHKQDHLAGTIAVGSGELQSSRFLTQLIAAFQKENPLVSFRIYSGNSDNIKERIERGLLDIGLLQEPVDIANGAFWCAQMPNSQQRIASARLIWPVCRSFCRTAKMCRTNCSTGSAPLRRNCVLRPLATCFIIWPFLPATAGAVCLRSIWPAIMTGCALSRLHRNSNPARFWYGRKRRPFLLRQLHSLHIPRNTFQE